MFDKLIKRITGMLSLTIKKADLVLGIELLNKIVGEDLKTENDALIAFLKDGKNTKPVVEAIAVINSTVKSERDAIKYIGESYAILEELGKSLLDITMENFGKVVVRDNMSAKEVAIYSLMETYNFLVGAHSDLLIFAAFSSTEDKGYIYNKKDEFLRITLKEYRRAMKELSTKSVKRTIKDIDSLTDVIVTANPELLNDITSPSDRKLMLPRNNFDGNPLVIFGKWWVDIKVSRAEKLEYDAKLLKLKLNALREQAENGGVSFELSKQIAYYETKITEIDKKIIDLLGE